METIATLTETVSLPTKDFMDVERKPISIDIVRCGDSSVQFQWQLPASIHAEAKRIKPDSYGDDFKRMLRAPILKILVDEIQTITREINTFHTFKDAVGDKVLFIRFYSQSIEARDSNYGTDMGKEITIKFQFFTGYKFVGKTIPFFSDEEIEIEKYSGYYKCSKFDGEQQKYLEAELKPLHHTSRDLENIKREYVIIPYTEERELFLKNIQNNFISLSDKLSVYLKDLSETKLDALMASHPNLLQLNSNV